MSHTVAVGQFEGPLGLLLDLVERQKLSVSDIAVGAITSEYLARVQELEAASVDDLSEFLQLGARLLYIKSLALLPSSADGEEVNELAQLQAELTEYRRFKAAATLLAERATRRRTWERPAARALAAADLPLPNISLEQLAAAFSSALKAVPAAEPATIIRPHLSLEKVTAALHRRLAGGFDLADIIADCHDRLEVIVTFLAVLELVRGGAATISQDSQFDPIRVEAARG